MLVKDGIPEEELDSLIEEVGSESPDHPLLGSPERALLAYARKLTLDPATIEPDDIDSLRSEGFDDPAIHDACSIVAYFAFVNRIADGLGVELEERFGKNR